MTTADAASPTFTGDSELDDSANAFLTHFGIEDASKKKPSETEGEDTTMQPKSDDKPDPKASEQEAPEETEEDEKPETEEKPKTKKFVEEDEVYVKVKEGENEHEVPISQLKRLFGQEAALTRRSQEVADQRKAAEAETVKAGTVLQLMLQKAQERAKPFENIDFLMAAKELSHEELTQLRTAAQSAFEEKKFLESEVGTFMQGIQQKQNDARITSAKEAVKALTDQAGPHYVEGWGDKLYGDLREFGVKNGITTETMNSLVDAPVFKLLHQAMLYQRGLEKVVTTKKVDKTPKKIVKSSKAADPSSVQSDKAKDAMKRLRDSGTQDDAADVFFQRMQKADSD